MQLIASHQTIIALLRCLTRHQGMAACLCAFFLLYVVLAAHAFPADDSWLFDAIEAVRLFAIDDAYRFFETRSAWHHADVWSWMYLLPVDLAFNGLLHTLTNSDLFMMRMAHVLTNLVGVAFLYRCCLMLGVTRPLAVLSCAALMAMPLFAVASMSFYGESLLTALLPVTFFAHLAGHRRLFCLLASLLPLVHQEGFYFIAPFFLYYLLRREFLFFVLLALPGFLYFVNLIVVHGSPLQAFGHTQLHKLYPALPTPFQQRGWTAAFVTLNPFLLLLAAAGMARAARTPIWPAVAGMLLWLVTVVGPMSHLNGYEPRYLMPCLPMLFLLSALALQAGYARLRERGAGAAATALLVAAPMLALAVENLGQSDPLRANLLGGQRWPGGQVAEGARYFFRVLADNHDQGRDAANRIHNFLRWNPDVRLLFVNRHEIFYFLDRRQMPDAVRVVYSPFLAQVAHEAFGGRMLGVSANHPQAAFYRFHLPGLRPARAVFVGDFSFLGWKPAYENRAVRIHEASYEIVSPPRKLRIVDRLGDAGPGSVPYWTRNLCAEEPGYYCPDW